MLNHHPRKICCSEFDDTGVMPCRHRGKSEHHEHRMNIYYMLAVLVLGYALGCLYKQNCLLKSEIENLKLSHINQNSCLQSSEESLSQHKQSADSIHGPETRVPKEAESFKNPSKLGEYCENLENSYRRVFIREMMRNAWNAYTRNAWGYESLKPVYREPKGNGQSIIASMSTLWVMELKTEFEQARNWVEREMNFEEINQNLNVFSVVTDYIGGLLSSFALTGDRMFVDKAAEIAQIMRPAYRTSTSLPVDEFNPNGKKVLHVRYDEVTLSQISQQLEYRYLADISSDKSWIKVLVLQQIESLWKFIRNVYKPQGLNMFRLFPELGEWSTSVSTLWENSSEFYFNLLKSYIQTGGTNQEVIQWYREALDAVKDNGMFTFRPFSSATTSEPVTPILYVREYGYIKNKMPESYPDRGYDTRFGASSCQLGAMLSLGSSFMIKDSVNWMEIALNITEGCQELSDSTKTGLMPAVFDFEDARQRYYHYSLSPQLAQSNFILWRLTRNQKYRENAWKMVQSIHQHCRTEDGGYSSIQNVNQVPTVKSDYQPPHFLSATLKYLYLTFTDDSVLPLYQWVFNSAGHPLPICGTSDAYPAEKCN